MTPRDDLIVCPKCDALYTLEVPQKGQRAVCARCHTVLIAPRRRAGAQIMAIATAALILIVGATVFPFLKIDAVAAENSVSILDAAFAFDNGLMVLLAFSTAALIIFIPLLRAMLVLYVLTPVVFDRPPGRHAIRAFRLSEALRPWAMAEVFAIGCAVALVKLSDLAQIELGPGFWMFAILVVLVVAQDSFMCRWSVWNSLK